MIKITMADGGVMTLELYPEIAPKTVENFESLVNKGFYNGLIFHRVIAGFMIQGGGFTDNEPGLTEKKATYPPIKGEFLSNGYINNIKHQKGVISMARTFIKDSANILPPYFSHCKIFLQKSSKTLARIKIICYNSV